MTTIYPTRITREQLDDCTHRDMLVELLHRRRASSCTRAKEATIGAENLREIERRVMLSMIDQHWREHLYEMDYLREGINLRAMGQKDPLAEWQREGFDMFEAMMGQIQDQFVAYVSHLQVAAVEEAPRAPGHRADAVQRRRGRRSRAPARCGPPPRAMPRRGARAATSAAAAPDGGSTADRRSMMPVRVDKTPGRNEPCFCGSGKKYKLCHGR